MTSLNTLNIIVLAYELKKAKLESVRRKSHALFFRFIAQCKAEFLNTALKLMKLFWKVLYFNIITAAIIKNLATTLSRENPSVLRDLIY